MDPVRVRMCWENFNLDSSRLSELDEEEDAESKMIEADDPLDLSPDRVIVAERFDRKVGASCCPILVIGVEFGG